MRPLKAYFGISDGEIMTQDMYEAYGGINGYTVELFPTRAAARKRYQKVAKVEVREVKAKARGKR